MEPRISAQSSIVARWMRAALLAPSLWLALFASIVVRVRLVMGEWPHDRNGNPIDGSFVPSTVDPQEFELHYLAIWYGFVALTYLVPSTGLALLASCWIRRLRAPPILVATFVASVVLAFALIRFDLGGFWFWFLD